MEFIVIDTEGSDTLREIAIINQDGRLVYEAFVRTRGSTTNRLNQKPLTEIVRDLQNILPNKTIICHKAQHDRTILKNSFRRCRQQLPPTQFICTLELAQKQHPNLNSYQLGNLCRRFFLQVDNLYFKRVQAHRARYDAQFTLQLYLYLTSPSQIENNTPMTVEQIVTTPSIKNPFSSSRVDDPYQNHLDFEHIYRSQFYHLKSLVEEIKQDREQLLRLQAKFFKQVMSKILSLIDNPKPQDYKSLQGLIDIYRVDQGEFLQEFNAGILGDNIDFFEWFSLWELRKDILSKISKLEQGL